MWFVLLGLGAAALLLGPTLARAAGSSLSGSGLTSPVFMQAGHVYAITVQSHAMGPDGGNRDNTEHFDVMTGLGQLRPQLTPLGVIMGLNLPADTEIFGINTSYSEDGSTLQTPPVPEPNLNDTIYVVRIVAVRELSLGG